MAANQFYDLFVHDVCVCVSPATEWVQQYTQSFIETEKLQQIVDSFMEDYDKRKEEVRILLVFLRHRSPHQIHVMLTCVCFLFFSS